MVPPVITIVTFGFFEDDLIRGLAAALHHESGFPVIHREGYIDMSDFFDPSRRQYDGNKLLKAVDSMYGENSYRTIGLFTVDIFIPILTFIFGQAYLNGRTGIASNYRLNNEIYGMAADAALKDERFIKEVIHEVGHTLGLIHCHVPDCVMRSGTYVEDIDQKSQAFCSSCREKLEPNNM